MDIVLDDFVGFCQKQQKLEGKVKIADLERLVANCADPTGEIQWTVAGTINSSGYPQLDLAITGRMNLICQRCLETFVFDLDSQASIILADSEEKADEIEDSLKSDDPTEVIVMEPDMNILVLVEDEALLAIPLSPKHEVCPDADSLVFTTKRESPFAVLKSLKTGNKKKN